MDHFAQMRVSNDMRRRVLTAKRAQEVRLSVADKLATLALTEGTSANDLIVTQEEAVALQQTWKQGQFDEGVRKIVEQIARNRDEADAIIDEFANRKLPAAQFGRSLPEMLKTKQFVTSENTLIQGLNKWEGFYRRQ
jgi:hypothetical protein